MEKYIGYYKNILDKKVCDNLITYFEKSKGFNLKSGNKPEFKNIGSSPVKQKIDPLDYGRLDDAMEFGREYEAKKIDKANKENIDYEKLFDRALLKKIRMFYEALNWDMPVDKINTLERFF